MRSRRRKLTWRWRRPTSPTSSPTRALRIRPVWRRTLRPRLPGSPRPQANVAQAEAALQQAQLSRSYAEIHAPYAGLIAQVNVDPFDASTTVGQPAIRMLDLSKLRVEVQISDADIARVHVGQALQVHSDTLDKVYNGKVSYIAPEATTNSATRSYLVRIDLDQQDGLRSGMQVTVDIAA